MDKKERLKGLTSAEVEQSKQKFGVNKLSEAKQDGVLDMFLDALKDICGVGDKVADCVRLFGLHHLEAFPIDTHIKQVIDREYGGKMPEWVHSKYAGVFQQYIFYYETNCRK